MRMKSLFSIPDGEKVTEKMLRRVLISSICSILLCMACLASTTWAWFTVSIENTGNVIQIASVETEAILTCGNEEVSKSADGGYELKAGTAYTLTISAVTDSSAKNSNLYAILSQEGTPFGYVTMVEDSSTATLTTAQTRRYTASVTITPTEDCKLSWTVSWLKPNPDEIKEITNSAAN